MVRWHSKIRPNSGIPLACKKLLAWDSVLYRLARPSLVFFGEYILDDRSIVVLYTNREDIFREYQPRARLLREGVRRVKVSLIAVARNEVHNVSHWCDAVLGQTRIPDEIVVVDTGSQDGTLQELTAIAERSPIPFRVISAPGANIARGRNIAIARSCHPIVAVTDFGCQPENDWLEKLIAPFELDPDIQVAAGLYMPVDRKGRPVSRGRWKWSTRKGKLEPKSFPMSGASAAFTREAWKSVGGYPEWLTLTGEDTYFALELKRLGGKWAFVPDAVVKWMAPENAVSYWLKMFRWAVGDGESGVRAQHYWSSLLRVLGAGVFVIFWLGIGLASKVTGDKFLIILSSVALLMSVTITAFRFRRYISSPLDIIWEAGGELAKVGGFIWGSRRRPEVLARRLLATRGTWFVFSGVPIDDTGGGSRATQLSLELLRQGFSVVFVYKFRRNERTDLGLRVWHPNLLVYSISALRTTKLLQHFNFKAEGRLLAAIVESPLRDFVFPIGSLRKQGAIVIYDLMDDWTTSLGGNWYSEGTEKEIIGLSQVLVATAPVLMDRLRNVSGRAVIPLPNAVDSELFNPDRNYTRPDDLPPGEWTIMYIGALWGEWFDWELVRRIALAYSEAKVILIGDYRRRRGSLPPNLHLLGLKSHQELPGYLAYADVAIIPWEVNAITRATSPLKLYEYLAMRKPVVAPSLDAFKGIPGVIIAEDRDDFLAKVELARRMKLPERDITMFIKENDWCARIRQLLEIVSRATV